MSLVDPRPIRFLFLSAVVSEETLQDVARWLGTGQDGLDALTQTDRGRSADPQSNSDNNSRCQDTGLQPYARDMSSLHNA
jgi:hypothetical protein